MRGRAKYTANAAHPRYTMPCTCRAFRGPRRALDVRRVAAGVGKAARDGAERVDEQHAARARKTPARVEEAALPPHPDDRAHRVEEVAQHDRERDEQGRDHAESRE